MHEPELLVPASERRPLGGWRLTLLRLWCVLALIAAWAVFTNGEHALHFRAAVFTLVGFYAVGQVVAWIVRPVLPPERDQR